MNWSGPQAPVVLLLDWCGRAPQNHTNCCLSVSVFDLKKGTQIYDIYLSNYVSMRATHASDRSSKTNALSVLLSTEV